MEKKNSFIFSQVNLLVEFGEKNNKNIILSRLNKLLIKIL